jgi:hypothetical protein
MLDRPGIKVHVDRHLCEARELMSLAVRDSFDRVLRERCLLTADPAPYFGPLGHPLFELPVWVASRLGQEGTDIPEVVLSDVLGVSALGYLHVRAQDDWLDGPTREDPTLVALAEALMAMCPRLLMTVVGPSDRFWAFHAEVLTAYAESLVYAAALRERGAPVRRSNFEQLLAQSRPLVIPSAALLERADRWDLLPALEEFVFTATAASQLVNDLTDLFRDRRMGHSTWTLEAIGAAEADGLWTELTHPSSGQHEGRIQERINEALSFHERSAGAAQVLTPRAADGWIADRRSMLEGLLGSVRGTLIATFVRQLSGSDG